MCGINLPPSFRWPGLWLWINRDVVQKAPTLQRRRRSVVGALDPGVRRDDAEFVERYLRHNIRRTAVVRAPRQSLKAVRTRSVRKIERPQSLMASLMMKARNNGVSATRSG